MKIVAFSIAYLEANPDLKVSDLLGTLATAEENPDTITEIVSEMVGAEVVYSLGIGVGRDKPVKKTKE